MPSNRTAAWLTSLPLPCIFFLSDRLPESEVIGLELSCAISWSSSSSEATAPEPNIGFATNPSSALAFSDAAAGCTNADVSAGCATPHCIAVRPCAAGMAADRVLLPRLRPRRFHPTPGHLRHACPACTRCASISSRKWEREMPEPFGLPQMSAAAARSAACSTAAVAHEDSMWSSTDMMSLAESWKF